MCDPKEPGFFAEDHKFARGMGWYESLFKKAISSKAIGEGTVNYSKFHAYPQAASRIAAAIPDARLIYLAREPLGRLVSEWKYRRLHSEEDRPFDRAIMQEPDYIETTRYLTQLGVFQKYFPEKQILVLFTEDMHQALQATLRRCCQFLGIDTDFAPDDDEPQNVGHTAVGTTPMIRRIRKIPGFELIRSVLPKEVKTKGFSFLGQREKNILVHQQKIEWNPELVRFVRQQLQEESQSFLVQWGKPKDFWNFIPDASPVY